MILVLNCHTELVSGKSGFISACSCLVVIGWQYRDYALLQTW